MEHDGSSAIRYVDAFFRNKLLILFVAGSILAGTFLYALLAKRQYGSTMKILVQNTRAVPIITGDRDSPLFAGGGGSEAMEAQINSEVVLMQSADLMEGLVRYRDRSLLGLKAPDTGSLSMAHELGALQARMEVTPIRKTNFIEVQLRDLNPAVAQKSLAWLSTAFLDKHAQLRRPAGTFKFFNSQAVQYEEQLRDAQAKLIDFQRANDLVSLDKEKAVTLDGHERVTQAIGETEATLEDSDKRLTSYRRQMDLVHGRITTQVKESPNEYSAERLNSLLVDMRNKRAQLAMRFQASDPLVREVDEQIQLTQAALEKANAQHSVETVSDNNPVSMSMEQALRTATAEANGEKGRLAVLQGQAQAYAGRLVHLQEISVQNDTLERNIQELKQNYDTYVQKRDEANINDQLDRSKIADVSIAQEPTISLQPVQPHRLMILLLGMAAACVTSLGCVLVKDALRETAFTPAELQAMVSCPVLATTPEEPSVRALGRGRNLAGEQGKYRALENAA